MTFRRKRTTGIVRDIDSLPVFGYVNKKSLLFDGVDEYVELSNPGAFTFVTGGVDKPFSVSVWVKMVDATRFRIMCKGDVAVNREWLITGDASDKLIFFLYGNPNGSVYIAKTSNAVITGDQGAWHHYVCTYNGSAVLSGIDLYRDGAVLASTGSSAGAYTSMGVGASSARLASFLNSSDYANGLMDEVMVFNKSLSLAEVQEIYNSGKPMRAGALSTNANIVEWWRMGDGISSFPTMPGQKGISNGTLTNMESGDIVEDTP